MTSRTKLWALSAGALALSLALAGCGGGGGSSTSTSGGPSTTMPTGGQQPAPTTVALTEVTTDDEGYMAPEAGTIEIEAGMSATSGTVTFMCAAGGDDCTVTVADDGTVTSTGGTVTAMNSEAFQTALATAAAAEVAATTKAAETKETAIATEAGQTADAGLGGSGAPATGAGEYTLAIAHGETSITVEGATDADDEKFMQTMDLGGGATMHTRTMDADANGNVVEEVAVVVTDIEAPKATAFGMVHTLNANPETSGGMDYQSLAIAPGNLSMLTTDGITSTGSGTITLLAAVDDNPDTPEDETVAAFETAAMFDGASGTLKCGGTTDCTVTLDADGMMTAVTGTWIFTPAAGATVDVADTDYLHYGFWLQKTTDSDGVLTYDEVETFADSSVAASGDISAVEGTATYEGGATGVYVHSVTNEDGTRKQATSGHFFADASLTAYFGGNRVPTDKQDTLTGTIDNFMLSGGEEQSWSVALQSDGDPNTAGIQPDTDGVLDGTAKGGVTGQDGSFRATFHGSVAADSDGVVPHPGSVVGEFNSVFSNGSVAGAFGARKQ